MGTVTDEQDTPETDDEEQQEESENNDWTGPHRTPGLGY